jgi:hypothetical protein
MAPSGCSRCSLSLTPGRLLHSIRQGRLADLDRLPPQVRAVELEQVEGVEECLRLIRAVAEQVEGSHPLLGAAHHLAVDEAGPHL